LNKLTTWQFLLRVSVFLIFIGRAYQFYFFGAPFRAILWDESLLAPLVESLLNRTWNEYATNTSYSDYINIFTRFCSIILMLGALTALFWNTLKLNKLKKTIISLGIIILFILGICIFKDKNYSILQVFELFIQISLPLVLLFAHDKLNEGESPKKVEMFLRIAISVTFIAHGLYAMGIPFYPGHFIDMTISITGMTEDQSKIFLSIAGFLDIVAAISLYFKRTFKYALIYILIWGILTATARIVSGFNSEFILDSVHNSLYATIYRLPHGLIAAVLFLLTYSQLRISKSDYNES